MGGYEATGLPGSGERRLGADEDPLEGCSLPLSPGTDCLSVPSPPLVNPPPIGVPGHVPGYSRLLVPKDVS